MALISPVLDNRTFEQLRDELLKRVPVYTPEWTNFNQSDPAIALLEVFAYLGESLLFRFNQIPDTTKLAFLRLLGVQPRPAQPASVLLAARTELPFGAQVLRGTEARAGSVPFQTENEVYVWPLDVIAAGKTPAPTQDLSKAEQERRQAATAYAKVLDPLFYQIMEVPADPLAPDAQPLDVSETADRSLWFALMRKDTTDLSKLGGRTLFVGVAFDETVAAPFAPRDRTSDVRVPRGWRRRPPRSPCRISRRRKRRGTARAVSTTTAPAGSARTTRLCCGGSGTGRRPANRSPICRWSATARAA